jgi:hypothetical protein
LDDSLSTLPVLAIVCSNPVGNSTHFLELHVL